MSESVGYTSIPSTLLGNFVKSSEEPSAAALRAPSLPIESKTTTIGSLLANQG